MIESTIPEIDVAELMERVRAEALRPKKLQLRKSAAALPPVAMLPAAPDVWIPGTIKSRQERLKTLVQTAREKNEPSSRIPKFLRRFFRKQGGYNRAIIESISALSKSTDDLTRRVGEISACLGHFNGWLLALHEQSDADAAWMRAAAPGVSRIAAHEDELGYLQADLASARATLDNLSTHASRHEALEREVAVVTDRLSAAEKTLNEGAEATANLALELRSRLDHSGNELLRSELDQVGTHLRNLQAQTDRLGVHVNNLQGLLDKSVAATAAGPTLSDQLNEVALIKGELSEHGSLLRQLLAPDSKGAAASKKDRASRPTAAVLDSFYFGFENRFRGSRDEIKRRVAFYLPFVRQVEAGTSRNPILDLGCGRGEWLELLKGEKLDGRGVDLNTVMIAQCKARKLKVRLGDAIEHLRSLRANSLGAITGFHIIEHLRFGALMELFSQARRVLMPGGVAIFESPNCKNLIVGACNFHVDPTHRHPVFPETAQFILASHGFEKIQIEYLSPVPDARFSGNTPELATLKDLLFGPQDFGIIAYKPRKR